MKVVGTGEGSAHVDELHNDGNVTFGPDGDSDTTVIQDGGSVVDDNAPVAIIQDEAGLHIGKLTTDGVLNAAPTKGGGNTYIIDLVGTENSVQNFGLI